MPAFNGGRTMLSKPRCLCGASSGGNPRVVAGSPKRPSCPPASGRRWPLHRCRSNEPGEANAGARRSGNPVHDGDSPGTCSCPAASISLPPTSPAGAVSASCPIQLPDRRAQPGKLAFATLHRWAAVLAVLHGSTAPSAAPVAITAAPTMTAAVVAPWWPPCRGHIASTGPVCRSCRRLLLLSCCTAARGCIEVEAAPPAKGTILQLPRWRWRHRGGAAGVHAPNGVAAVSRAGPPPVGPPARTSLPSLATCPMVSQFGALAKAATWVPTG